MKRTIAASAALALALGVTVIGTAAHADDLPPEVTTQEAVIETASKPKPPEPDRLAICHSGSGANWAYIAPDASGYNGHQHHDADVYGLTEAECLAKNPVAFVPYATAARWLLPATWDRHTTPSYQAAIFPQDRLADGAPVPCDRWSQDDGYWIENAADELVWVSLGDVLTQGEDSAIYAAHVFTYGGDCAPPPTVPEPRVTITRGEYGDAVPTCELPEVTLTRTVTTTTIPYKVVGGPGTYEVVEDLENASVVDTIESIVRTLGEDVDCTPVEEPPVEEPTPTPVPVPVASTPTDSLADTGEDLGGLWVAGALGFAGALALIGRRVFARR